MISYAKALLLVTALTACSAAFAETGAKGWLRDQRITDRAASEHYRDLSSRIVHAAQAPITNNAANELAKRLASELGLQTHQSTKAGGEDAFLLGTPQEIHAILPNRPVDTIPPEASGGKAMICKGQHACTLSTKLNQSAGRYDIAIQYFDLRGATSHYELLLNGAPVARWAAEDILPPAVNDAHLDGHTSTRHVASDIAILPGDTLTLRGTPDRSEPAPVDYVELMPAAARKANKP